MQFAGQYHLPGKPQTVWSALNDPEVLKACIPGCQTLDRTDHTHFVASARLKIGPMNSTFKGTITLTDMDPPRRCVLTGQGQGGVAGFAKGSAEINLTPAEAGTMLSYTAKANVGGKLAQIGQRLLDGAARQIADDFFARFSTQVAGVEEAALSFPDVVAEPPSPISSPEAPLPPRRGATAEIWVIGLIAVIVILLAFFGLVLKA